ncbi:DUF4214 domain-containing protein [Duganella sp. LX20W]|uniref:DUF4214 domain-containing protein n=1 Tax=Rugamonas brunnea TaxID=2758569 RepID=A0A7W2ICN1_9BURK|nr:DUF4214 domain-containing protein [Rugamonas brunnea]MBA5638400.1 DUF4214 domain-containing protein [Rugamonas brunnea]
MTTSATTDWIAALADNGVRNDLATAAADGVLSYNEALRVLNDTAADGTFTAAEFQALQTVAAHLNNGVTATSYVADIFTQLVLGNPANIAWHGGSTDSATLGNLRADSSVTQLNELISKWFLGTDMPDLTMVPDNQRSVTQPQYRTVSGPLYGHTGAAAIVDVAQGALGDCVVCASMIEMVNNHPDLLKSMIVDNGNGTYGVRFYLHGNEVWVTVNQQLPTDAYGHQVYGHNGAQQEVALWMPLLEKAYAQLSETGMVGHPAVNSYENIDGNITSIVLPAMSNARVTYYSTTASDWADKKAMLVAALAAHRDVVFETTKDAPHTYDSDGMIELVGWHAFAVLGYDAGTDKFIVRNPWGDNYASQNWTAQFEVSMDEMQAEGGGVAVAASLSSPVVQLAGVSHKLGLSAAVDVAPLFAVFNPDALPVSRYLFHAAGSGALDLHGATDLATAEQHAAGDVVIGAADLARLQFLSPGADGAAVLSIQALVGQQWSAANDIHWTFSGTSADTMVLPKVLTAMDTGAIVSLSSLFQLDGANDAKVFYEVSVPDNGGTLEVHGARNLWPDAKPGEYEFNAADLRLVTYQAPSTAGMVTLQICPYHGDGWGGWQNINIQVGTRDVAHALQNYANGQLALIGPVHDASAAVFANLDGLNTLLHSDRLGFIQITDDVAQVQSMTGAQFDQYRGVFAAMRGNFSLHVTDASLADAPLLGTSLAEHVASAGFSGSAADVAANLDVLQTLAAAGRLAGITLTDSGTATLSITGTQMAADSAALRLIAGDYHVAVQDSVAAVLAASATSAVALSYTISDSAANVNASLDALQALAAAGKLSAITLTDSGQATLKLGVAKLFTDGAALDKLLGHYTLAATGANAADAAKLAPYYPQASFTVSDSAAQVQASLAALQALAAQGRLFGLTLTDGGMPVLSVTADQLVDDGALLRAITSPYKLSVAGVGAGAARFVLQQGAMRTADVQFHPSTDGQALAGQVNTVVGFQNATLGQGHHAVVLDGARDHYAVRLDSSGQLELKNIAAGDADYNKSVTIHGVSYIVFNGAATDAGGNYPNMYFVADAHNAAVAELYVAALGRLPDLRGLEYWETLLGGGSALTDIAASFIASQEFQLRFPAAASPADLGGAADQAFVTALYQNVLHRAPDAGGLHYWLDRLANGGSRADVLVSFALSPEDESNTHAAPGHQNGWLIDTNQGGYADSATLLPAATVLNQGLANGYLNTGLIAAASIGTGVAAGGISLAGHTLTLAQGLTAQSVVLSSVVDHLLGHGNNNQIYSGGHATIAIDGVGNTIHMNGADRLDLLDGSDTLVINFAPGSGATLHLAQGQPTLLSAAASQVSGAALNSSQGYVIQVGSLGDGSAGAAAAAINAAYAVAATSTEHITFIGQDSSGNMEAWRFGAGSTGNVTADANGNHQVDAAELVHLATLIGVNAAQLHATDLA